MRSSVMTDDDFDNSSFNDSFEELDFDTTRKGGGSDVNRFLETEKAADDMHG